MNLGALADELCRAASAGQGERPRCLPMPSHEAIVTAVEDVRSAFFPFHLGAFDASDAALRRFVCDALGRAREAVEEQVGCAFAFAHVEGDARAVARSFFEALPHVRALAASDVDAAFAGDPALRIRDEAIFSYPGPYAIALQRLAHELYALSVPLLPRMITEHAHARTGIDIHPGAQIGERFFIDHGTGVVIGETARIGRNVRLYQGVTLGARAFAADAEGRLIKGLDRHPIVEDDVVIYAGATVLGRITVGRGSIIGGNVWVTASVPPGSRVTQAAASERHFEGGSGI